jgi:hypothetical protein
MDDDVENIDEDYESSTMMKMVVMTTMLMGTMMTIMVMAMMVNEC